MLLTVERCAPALPAVSVARLFHASAWPHHGPPLAIRRLVFLLRFQQLRSAHASPATHGSRPQRQRSRPRPLASPRPA